MALMAISATYGGAQYAISRALSRPPTVALNTRAWRPYVLGRHMATPCNDLRAYGPPSICSFWLFCNRLSLPHRNIPQPPLWLSHSKVATFLKKIILLFAIQHPSTDFNIHHLQSAIVRSSAILCQNSHQLSQYASSPIDMVLHPPFRRFASMRLLPFHWVWIQIDISYLRFPQVHRSSQPKYTLPCAHKIPKPNEIRDKR